MRQNARDLAHAAVYLCCLASVFVFTLYGAAFALKGGPQSPVVVAAVSALHPDSAEPARLAINVATSREIRAALAKPIPRLEKLPPITAKVAYGHLKPGGKGQPAIATAQQLKKKISKAALNAMAMDISDKAASVPQQAPFVRPELHKVY
jgi:hypothetical protein